MVEHYVRLGLNRDEAGRVAYRLIQNPEAALTQLAREELGIDPEASQSPLREGAVTGLATAVGAVIPIVPFLVLPTGPAMWAGIAISMASHFAVGASRAIFTGRPAIRTGGPRSPYAPHAAAPPVPSSTRPLSAPRSQAI